MFYACRFFLLFLSFFVVVVVVVVVAIHVWHPRFLALIMKQSWLTGREKSSYSPTFSFHWNKEVFDLTLGSSGHWVEHQM